MLKHSAMPDICCYLLQGEMSSFDAWLKGLPINDPVGCLDKLKGVGYTSVEHIVAAGAVHLKDDAGLLIADARVIDAGEHAFQQLAFQQ